MLAILNLCLLLIVVSLLIARAAIWLLEIMLGKARFAATKLPATRKKSDKQQKSGRSAPTKVLRKKAMPQSLRGASPVAQNCEDSFCAVLARFEPVLLAQEVERLSNEPAYVRKARACA